MKSSPEFSKPGANRATKCQFPTKIAVGTSRFVAAGLMLSMGVAATSMPALAGQIHTGGESGAYYSTFCPNLKKVLDKAHFPFECEISEGSKANIQRVSETPTDIGLSQLDVYALAKAETGGAKNLRTIRTDIGRECLFLISSDPDLKNFGQISRRAGELKFILPPQGSGHTATFEYLQKIDPEGLGLASNIEHASTTIDAVQNTLLQNKNTVTMFVQFPDASNKRFEIINKLGGHFIPVINRNILRQKVDGEKIYFAQKTEISNPKFWQKGKKVATSCTPIVMFTGNPADLPPGQQRVDQQDMIKTVARAPKRQLTAKKGVVRKFWKGTKSMSAGALAKLLDATERARESSAPALARLKEKTKELGERARPAWDATKEKAKELGERAKPAWDATKEKAKELGERAKPAWDATKEKTKELGERARPAWDATKEKAKELGERARPAWDATKEKAKELGERAKPAWDATKEKTKELGERARPAWDATKEKAKELGREAVPMTKRAMEKAKELGQDAKPAWDATKEKAKELGREAVPMTKRAMEKAGEYSQKARPFWEQTKERASQMSKKALESASEAARKAKEASKELLNKEPQESAPAAP